MCKIDPIVNKDVSIEKDSLYLKNQFAAQVRYSKRLEKELTDTENKEREILDILERTSLLSNPMKYIEAIEKIKTILKGERHFF